MKVANLQKYALPARANAGNLETLGRFKDLIEDTDKVRVGPKGITVTGADGTKVFFKYANVIKQGIKAGEITKNMLGNLFAYSSTIKGDDGQDRVFNSISYEQGKGQAALSGADFKSNSTQEVEQKAADWASVDLSAYSR